jgi:hypothetical protein
MHSLYTHYALTMQVVSLGPTDAGAYLRLGIAQNNQDKFGLGKLTAPSAASAHSVLVSSRPVRRLPCADFLPPLPALGSRPPPSHIRRIIYPLDLISVGIVYPLGHISTSVQDPDEVCGARPEPSEGETAAE